MTRYKGRQNAKAVEKDFPHFVILPSCLGARLPTQKSNHRHRRLLRARGKRPHGRSATKKSDKLAPLHMPPTTPCAMLNHNRLRSGGEWEVAHNRVPIPQ